MYNIISFYEDMNTGYSEYSILGKICNGKIFTNRNYKRLMDPEYIAAI